MPSRPLAALAAALTLAALMAACKPAVPMEAPNASATPNASTTPPANEAAKPALNFSRLPPAPETVPDPWVPYAVEKKMGAQWCPEDPNDDRGRGHGVLNRPCSGLLPRPLAEVLVAIPAEDIFLSTEVRINSVRQPQKYLAIPGHGMRPDFMANVDILEGITLRSFEGIDATDTVYLVEGPFRCIDNDLLVPREGEYVLQTAACQAAHADIRLYKWTGPGVLRDVTRDYLPVPGLTPAEQALTEPFRPLLDIRKLAYVPVMRWTIALRDRSPPGREHEYDYDPVPMPNWVPDSKRLDHELHFGFVVWNGKDFETRQRVPRSLWPIPYCDSLRPDEWCREYGKIPGRYDDLFVDEGDRHPAERSTP